MADVARRRSSLSCNSVRTAAVSPPSLLTAGRLPSLDGNMSVVDRSLNVDLRLCEGELFRQMNCREELHRPVSCDGD
ncbi:hypothetical protein EYF80_055605 [Liparis tanakae]|uniref:Uncharacterized protein n=1 Tax=Liparis tanakae TaxID=230148 RepID=A0A4Z2F174_9TELE|nr:hypothetical protein EYF80_055605 [Liparis tanakae]